MQTLYGEVIVETPRDRDGSFEPQTVKKRETILAEGMAEQIINMYASGTSTRDISKCFELEFGTRLSAETISSITDRVVPEIKSWRSRMLDPVYVYVVKQKCTTANVVIYSDISLFYYQKFFC